MKKDRKVKETTRELKAQKHKLRKRSLEEK